MTKRSVIIGLIGVVLICGVTFFSDRVLRQTHMIGNNLPVSVYGLLILFLMAIAPLLKKRRMTGAELAVSLSLILAACCIPGSGLLRSFTGSLVQPYHFNRVEVGWEEQQVLEMVPKRMLADVSKGEDLVIDGFRQSLRTGNDPIPVSAVPWNAWGVTFLFWLPIILSLWLAVLGLSLVIHRQWSEHEHVPYPIAAFTDSLLPEAQTGRTPVFSDRRFWIGAGIVFAIHMINFACVWWPDHLIPIKTSLDLTGMSTFFPDMVRGGGMRLLRPTLYFTVIGIAYLIPKEISLSFGIGPYIWMTLVGILALYGINLDKTVGGLSAYMSPTPKMFMLWGANLGMFAALCHSGRRHYRTVFRDAFRRETSKDTQPHELWGARTFLVMFVLLVFQLALVGIDWQLGALYVAGLMILYVVMSRLIAETGLFYIQPFVFPCVTLWGFFGIGAIGAKTLLLMQIVSMVLFIDPRESLMPFLTNSWKLLELREVKIGKIAAWSVAAILLGLLVALPITLYLQYDHGSGVFNAWADDYVPKFPFNNTVGVKQVLTAQGSLEEAGQYTGWRRWLEIRPTAACVRSFVAGLAAVTLFAAARLRFPWWPLHPLLFVTWATEPLKRLCASFLLGWIIKVCITKYGGTKTYVNFKPFMIGLIAGEVLGAVTPSIIGAIYYFVTGDPSRPFHVMPG